MRLFSLTRALVARKRKIFALFFALAASVGISWADVIPCTAADLGKVLCTDGSIYATVSEATAAGKTAAAVITYIDTENAKALALALADDGGEMDWATAKTTAPAHTPAVSGGTWTLASKDDWDNMITAAGGYTALRDGFSAVGGTNMNEDKYWSSTPENSNAWCYYFNYGMWVDGYVDNPCLVRACLAFDIPAPAPAKLPGAFTINANGDKIVFSKGNLQATTTDLGANWTWNFAPNQWSLIGNAVANNAIKGNKKVSANGTVDLFGWSTAATYYGINESWNNGDYAGDFVDWGALMGTEWRTLSRAEFRYIVFDRAQAFNKQGKATVNGVSGYIFLPDEWELPSGLSFTPSPGDYTTNQYDGANWEAMEAAGAVFLPAAGDREGTDIYMYDYGWYWTSTSTVDDKAYYLYFYEKGRDFVEHNRYDAKSVRLVTEAPIPPYEAAIKLINEIPNPVVLTAECKAKIDAARAAYDAMSDGDKAQVTNIATLTTAEAAFENVMNIWLSGDCDAILWKDTTLTIRKHAGEGNGAMADYTDYYGDNTAPWYNSHWYNPQPGDIVIKSVTLEEGVTHIGENAFGWMSELKTITIPSSVTSIGEDAFYWSKAVDDIYLTADPSNLTWVLPYSADNQFKPSKATLCHVPADLLTAYQEKFGTLNMTFVGDLDPITPLTPEQQQALDAAKDKIAAIPSPVVYTPACKDAIDAARAAYDALTPDMLKQLVSNYATLTAAEATYANLKDVVEVEAKINEIPSPMTAENTKLSVYQKVQDARAAYDALTAEQKALVTNIAILEAAEAAFAPYTGGGAAAGALNGKFTINAGGDQIAFAKGNLQATTADLGEHWTWDFAANQWNYLGIAVANSKINGNGTVSENGTVDLFGWSTAATYYGINNSDKFVDYPGDFVDWGPNMGAGWRTLTKDEWNYLIENNTKGRATVNDKNGYIFLPNDWSGPAFTPDPNNFTTNVYSGDDWTAMENAGAVFLPCGPARNRNSALVAMDVKYYSSTSLNNDSSYVFTIYYNQSQSACTVTNRAYGCMVRLVSAGVNPLNQAQAAKDLIDAIGEVSYPDSKEAIKAAREAVDALGANASLLDDADLQKLTDAEAAYAQLLAQAVKAVKDQIDALPAIPLTDATKKLSEYNKVTDARAAYDALSDEEKAAVTNYDKLEAVEAAFAAIPPVGSETVITWDKNTGIEKISGTTTSPAYEGITISIKGGGFGPQDEMLRFNIAGLGLSFEFANTLEGNFQKIVISSTNAMPSTPLAGMGEGWAASSGNKIATWTGDAATVKIWDGLTATSYWDVNTIQFTLGATVSATEAAQAAKDLIDAIPSPVVYTPECSAAIKAAREAVDALGENASLLDDADLQKLTQAETAYAGLLAEKVAPVIAAINAVPATPLTDATKKLSEYNKVTDARAAYDALSDEEKAAVTNYDKLTAAEEAFAAISGGTKPVDIVWDINTGINEVAINTTSPAYEGITVTTGKGNRFLQTTTDPNRLRFFFSGGAGRYAFAQEDGSHFTKVVLISSVAMGEWLREPSRIGTDWVVSDDYKKATWIGDADTVKIWDGASATAWVDVDSIVFTVNGTATPLADAQAALDKINAIPQPVVLSDECNAAIKDAREAVTALGENASLLDDADIAKLAKAEADFALLIKDAQAVMDLIDAIGEVTFSAESKEKIVDARNAYDELADELKPYVTNLATLTAAEAAYDAARPYATITTVPEAIENLYYNGLPQTLITAGAAEHGTMLYSLNGTDYSAQLPAAVLASAYTVYYKVQATDDYKDVAPATLTAAINYNYPTTFSLFGIPEGWRVKVNGTEATVVNGAIKNIAEDDKFDVLPTKPEDVKLVEVVPYILDLSNVTDSVIYVMNGDSITGTATGNITLIILPDAKVYFKDVNLTNTGEHPAVLCGGNAEIVLAGKNTISCTTEGMFGIRAAGVGTTLTLSGNKAQLTATIDPNGGTVNQ